MSRMFITESRHAVAQKLFQMNPLMLVVEEYSRSTSLTPYEERITKELLKTYRYHWTVQYSRFITADRSNGFNALSKRVNLSVSLLRLYAFATDIQSGSGKVSGLFKSYFVETIREKVL